MTCAVAPVTPLTLSSAVKASLFGIMSWRCLAQSEHGIARPRTWHARNPSMELLGRELGTHWADFGNVEPKSQENRCPRQLGVYYPFTCWPRLSSKAGLSLTPRRHHGSKRRHSRWSAPPRFQAVDHSTTRVGLRATGRD